MAEALWSRRASHTIEDGEEVTNKIISITKDMVVELAMQLC